MLDSLLSDVRSRRKQFIVYRTDAATDIESMFGSHNVEVTIRELPASGVDPFLVLEQNDEFAGAIRLADLEGLLEPPLVRPEEPDDLSEGYQVLFDLLDETVFTAMERSQLLAVTREIEDRAFRVGTGTLRVSFQTLSAFEHQLELYRQLATRADLDIHIHGVRDWTPPAIEGITYHEPTADTVERYWALGFDGGPDETQACGLVAKEQPDGYESFWTDDPEMVDRILESLEPT